MHRLTASLICVGGHDYIRDRLMRRKKSGQGGLCSESFEKSKRNNYNPRYLWQYSKSYSGKNTLLWDLEKS